ncbi:MAG: hypothetical protein SNJ75_02200 [Gemmataceae bacterium]
MLLLVVVLLVLYVVLSLLLAAWTVWFSGYLYEEPTGQIQWRGPLAGAIVFAPILLWLLLAYGSPGTYRPLWEFSSREVSEPFPEVWVPNDKGAWEMYRYIRGRREYRRDGNEKLPPLPSRPSELKVKSKGGPERLFKPERDDKGKLLIRKSRSLFSSQDEPLRYVDGSGAVMREGELGQVTTFKGSNLLLNVSLNGLVFVAWFVALWPILRFQWSHALGQAGIFWLVLMLFVMPPLVSWTESVAAERAVTNAATK